MTQINIKDNEMSCSLCHDLCVKHVIHSPKELCEAIRMAEQAIKAKILVNITTESHWNQYSFEECVREMIWGDVVDYHFACQGFGEQFTLGAETYHGSGGYWAPDTDKKRLID